MLGLRAFFVLVGYVRAADEELAHTLLDKMTFVGSLSLSFYDPTDTNYRRAVRGYCAAHGEARRTL